MSLFSKLFPQSCLNFEKCGDVVVSPKDNVIGLFCNYCCDIFFTLIEFLHHLRCAHNNVFRFSRDHNLLTVDDRRSFVGHLGEMQSQAEPRKDAQICNMGIGQHPGRFQGEQLMRQPGCDKGKLPDYKMINAAKELQDFKRVAPESVEEYGCEKKIKPLTDRATDRFWESSSTNYNSNAGVSHTNISDNHNVKEDLKAGYSNPVGIQGGNNVESFRLQKENIVDKKAEQFQSLQIKLENSTKIKDTTEMPIKENYGNGKNNSVNNLETPVVRNRPIFSKFLDMQSEKGNNKLNSSTIQRKFENDIELPKTNNSQIVDCESNAKIMHTSSSSIVISKVEYLPCIDLNFLKTSISTTTLTSTLETEMQKPLRRSSLSDISGPAIVNQTQTRRPSYSGTSIQTENSKQKQDSENPEIISKRKHSFYKSSSSIEEDKIKLDNSKIKIPKYEPSDSTVDIAQINVNNSLPKLDDLKQQSKSLKPKLRSDSVLLQFVGLPIIKDLNYEDRKPVEFCEVLRSKATKFSKILKEHEIIWSSKKCKQTQPNQKIVSELKVLTEQANKSLKANLSVCEMKRILNLISTWYTQQNTKKLFRKAYLPITIETNLLLFGFLPKLNRCVYYCEWCDECSTNKSRYKKHLLSHHPNVNEDF